MNKKIIISSLIGQIVEWYDFVLYGFFAPILAKLFFPHSNSIVALIEVYGTFAAGFLTRPLGGLVFGSLGDRYGRKNIFSATIFLMGMPSILIGLIPSYDMIGIIAPILLLLMRMIQGLSCGGEFIGSIIFLGEHSSITRRGFYSSLAWVGSLSGSLIASLTAVFLTSSFLNQSMVYKWGWRVAFILGGLAMIIGIYLRKRMDEPLIFKKNLIHNVSNRPILESFSTHKKSMTLIMGINIQLAVLSYLLIVYMPTYLATNLNFSMNTALFINTLSILSLIILTPFCGQLSDHIGRKPVLFFSTIGLILAAYPSYLMLISKSYLLITTGQLILILLAASIMGTSPSATIEQVPTSLRYTASSIPYNFIMSTLGGTAPLITTFFIHKTGNLLSPAIYLIICSIISLLFICKIKESFKKNL